MVQGLTRGDACRIAESFGLSFGGVHTANSVNKTIEASSGRPGAFRTVRRQGRVHDGRVQGGDGFERETFRCERSRTIALQDDIGARNERAEAGLIGVLPEIELDRSFATGEFAVKRG